MRQLAEVRFKASGKKQRLFGEFRYGAKSWGTDRRVIAKVEHSARGANPRFVVTNLTGGGQRLYDRLYCARGEMENRIKEQQLDLFADRTSCHDWWANQFRLLLSSLAYTLMETIRRLALYGTDMARAQCGTIRLKLLRIGAIVIRNTRRIRLLLSSAHPNQQLFFLVASRLSLDALYYREVFVLTASTTETKQCKTTHCSCHAFCTAPAPEHQPPPLRKPYSRSTSFLKMATSAS